MKDEDIIRALRASQGTSPVEIAELLGSLAEGGLTQATFVTYFSRSFPAIPLRVLLDAGAWSRLSGGDLDDTRAKRRPSRRVGFGRKGGTIGESELRHGLSQTLDYWV